MSFYYILEADFNDFISKMIKSKNVIAPVAKRTKFVFSKLEDPKDLRLDYDVTILPPKKEFFPTNQNLLKFENEKYGDCICPEDKVLFGVHFYDVKGIDMTDYLFEENNRDENYLANRCKTTIIASNIQNVFKRAFFASVGKEVKPKGHDGFLTKISDGYVFEVITDKAKDLLSFGNFSSASQEQINQASKVNQDVMDKCPEELKYESKDIAKKVRDSFTKEEIWDECATDCFSCGSCNIVCPTCYCFDVQDNWNVDQKSGDRTRYWDACLTEDFSKVSLGGGATENFREKRSDRFRHRIMRKAAYLNEKLGGPACVGCGRCSSSCTADIADPVNVINKIMEAK